MADGLLGVAEAALQSRAKTRGQRLVLRQRAGAVRRARGADRPAGFGRPHGRRVRQAPEDRGRGAEQAPRRLLHHAEGRLLRLPQHQGTGFKAKPLAARLLEEEGVATIGGPDFGILGEGYMRLSYANSAENIKRAIARMAEFLARNRNMAGG